MGTASSDKRDAFAKKMSDVLNLGALNLAMGMGYELGLFEVLDGLEKPDTPENIASKAGLSARYVKEWLGVMVCGNVVELSEEGNRELFFLPPEHGDFLAARAGENNLGVYTQEIPLLTQCAKTAVIRGFRSGEGVDYSHYPDFQAFMSQLADAKHEKVLIQTFLPCVDSGRLVENLEKGIQVMDLGCGEGVALNLMAKAFPHSEFTGIDISAKALETAAEKAGDLGLSNVQFLEKDAALLAGDKNLAQAFDWVVSFDSIHDQTRPQEALEGVFSALKTNGSFSMVDIAADSSLIQNQAHPMGAFLYAVSLMHCMPVGFSNQGAGLGMMWGRQKAEAMLRRAGFSFVEVYEIPEDSFNLHFFCKKTA